MTAVKSLPISFKLSKKLLLLIILSLFQDPSQTRIPRFEGSTRIPLPNSLRSLKSQLASKITRPTFANFLRHPQKLLKLNSNEKLDEVEKFENPAKKFKKTPKEFNNVTTTVIMDVDKPKALAGQDETITIQRKSICSETILLEKDNLTYEVECADATNDMLNVTVNIDYPDDTIIISSQTDPVVLNSTMNSDRLIDVTQVLPGFLNLTDDFDKNSKTFVNTTDLLCMSQTDGEDTLVQRTLDFGADINEQTKPPDMDMSFDISEEADRNSTPIDALKQLQTTSKPRFSFGLDLTDCTLDCSIELCDASLSSSTANKPLRSPCTNLIKQNSFDMDESLGILTPDQMKEFLDSATTTANLELPLEHISTGGHKPGAHQCRIDQTPSPEDLPLDPVSVKTDLIDVDGQQTAPSAQLLYQELSQTDSYSKNDQMTKSAASKVSNSFITSVTSITSLDTGYQGDGEMSRPASRGADHSPSNVPRIKTINQQNQAVSTNNNNNSINWNLNAHPPIPRRQEPMTDSDFFTESDADDAINRGGDRRAQIIDGQLYGPMLQAANVFINQQLQNDDSCMDSSGIFTDVDNRGDDDSMHRPINKDDLSPDASTDTMRSTSSEFRDETLSTPTNQTMLSKSNSCEENNKIVGSSQSLISDASLVSLKSIQNESPTDKKKITSTTKKVSPIRKQNKNEANVTIKKQEMAKRGTISPTVNRRDENQENKSPSAVCVSVNMNCVVRKPAPNKWDAVMNKIAENKTKSKSKLNLSDIKPKVTTGVIKRSPGLLKSPQSGCSSDGLPVAKRPLINSIKR